ncbi:MAG: aldo/keto reductase [Gammaproteobacteria bacterium]
MRSIGDTDLEVYAIGVGAMPLSLEGRPNHADARDVIDAFVEAGGNFIDTANVYCLDNADIGHNERLIREVLSQGEKPETVIVATKGGLTRPQGRWEVDGRPQWLRASCEKSLRDLGTEAISLYQLHAVDPQVDLAESLGELQRLKEEGKIRHIGVSNVSLDQLRYALRWVEIAAVQNRCNLFEQRDFDNGLVEFCTQNSITYIPHSPVGGHHGHKRLMQQPLLQELSTKYRESSYCIALAWLLQKGEHVLPIPGASQVSSIRDSMRAPALRLDPVDASRIDQLPDL